MAKSAWDQVRSTFKNEQEQAIEAMFPATNRFEMRQMTTELSQGSIVPFSMLGLFRRLYKSRVLGMFQEEYELNKVSLERQGRFELRDIVSARKADIEEKESR